MRRAAAADVAVAQIIGQDEDDIGMRRGCGRSAGRGGRQPGRKHCGKEPRSGKVMFHSRFYAGIIFADRAR